ncbi:hypothetical protein TrVFT333_003254 [Trichoderma virens FT-333]|nr:hypothetical protein TrVFT333_003254 [Trichoderma virens FT-333]
MSRAPAGKYHITLSTKPIRPCSSLHSSTRLDSTRNHGRALGLLRDPALRSHGTLPSPAGPLLWALACWLQQLSSDLGASSRALVPDFPSMSSCRPRLSGKWSHSGAIALTTAPSASRQGTLSFAVLAEVPVARAS